MNQQIEPTGKQMCDRLDSFLSNAALAVVPEPADGVAVEAGTRGHQIISDPAEDWIMVQTTVWVKSFRRKG